jgi:hypothetical protein
MHAREAIELPRAWRRSRGKRGADRVDEVAQLARSAKEFGFEAPARDVPAQGACARVGKDAGVPGPGDDVRGRA